MLVICLISGFCVLFFGHGMMVHAALSSAAIGAILGTAAELFTPSEYDTVTVPTVIAAALIIMEAVLL